MCSTGVLFFGDAFYSMNPRILGRAGVFLLPVSILLSTVKLEGGHALAETRVRKEI